MQNPFTLTFGRSPLESVDRPVQINEIIENFTADTINQQMFIITGVRGSGKTVMMTEISHRLRENDDVTSPTFALINEYIGGRLPLYHFDMYRISGWEDLYSTGFFDYIEQGGVIAAEWSENIENALPESTVTVTFVRLDDNKREVTVNGACLEEEK